MGSFSVSYEDDIIKKRLYGLPLNIRFVHTRSANMQLRFTLLNVTHFW